jgi:hypothetical protein
MTRSPERLAWLVLILAFSLFCFIIVAVPLGARYYLYQAQREQKATVEALAGTIVVEPAVGRGPTPLSKGQSMAVSEGTLLRADERSEAVVTFFDHSSMRVFAGSTVRLDRLRAPRFARGRTPNAIHINLLGGRVHIGTALSFDSSLDLVIHTLHARARLDADGSYTVEANNEASDFTSYRGHATVTAGGQHVDLATRQRTHVALNQAPEAPTGVTRDLVQNADFRQPLNQGWRVFNDQGNDGGDVDGRAEVVVDGGRRAVRFVRTGGEGNHCETILEQAIDKELSDPVTSMSVRATVKVRHQSLSGGGYLSSEYPLMIRVTYRDVYDSEAEWVQGFYYQNVSGTPTTFGLEIPQDRWYLYESRNLLEELPIRPYRIIKIRVYAAGWDYESLISDVNIIVE